VFIAGDDETLRAITELGMLKNKAAR